jgi:hypothetical protein
MEDEEMGVAVLFDGEENEIALIIADGDGSACLRSESRSQAHRRDGFHWHCTTDQQKTKDDSKEKKIYAQKARRFFDGFFSVNSAVSVVMDCFI